MDDNKGKELSKRTALRVAVQPLLFKATHIFSKHNVFPTGLSKFTVTLKGWYWLTGE
jgi:hypothetical protein